MAVIFAERMDLMCASEIREILKITQRPEVISFAGGLPAPELFPVEAMKQVAVKVLNEAGQEALQYSTTEGFERLRQQIAARMNRKFNTNVQENNVLITSGSQQALDFSGKLFLSAGDVVLCESPTYLAAISAFKAYQPRFIAVPTDDQGMIIEELKKILETTTNVKLIYIVPDFQNPTGRTWSLTRRQQLMEVVNEYELPVIEDNPYGELRFEGDFLPAVKSMDTKGLVIFVSTFSKTFCPGLRVGWIAADSRFIERYVLIKQGADLHTSSLSQREISAYMDMYDFESHIANIIKVYRSRRDAMVNAMEEYFDSAVTFTRPQGGLFTWVEMPKHIKAVSLLKECLQHHVAFVPGDSFFPNGGVENTFRLNYSNMPEERINEGIRRLAMVMAKYNNYK
ncbi:PLP-dependent aminotransferase family protein [Sporomusa malonica]|uniref:2-aminoadipate transaminase n=1 Tax=Sporomusa malonica TaxID=112901 RepID=A0A1W1ZY25_9FIRM|nr:PLP-dependent aminotransferase family protein [Sporomusa malonica]SMC53317.1 2-aminoadipate transaminase [Sporomusa malonica]